MNKFVSSFAGFTLVAGVPSAPDSVCSLEIIEQAASDGLLKHVVTECDIPAPARIADPTINGPSDCLASFVVAHQEGHPIPNDGACRQAYQSFVDNLYDDYNSACVSGAKTGEYSYTCAETMMKDAFESFQVTTGHSVIMQQCLRYSAYKMTAENAFEELATQAVDTTNSFVAPSLSDNYGLCYLCYSKFLSDVRAGSIGLTDVIAACTNDPLSYGCADSTIVLKAKANFKICSGYEIDFLGPVCTQNDVDTVQELIPVPYYTITHCAFNDDVFCGTVDSYFAKIEEESDKSCSLCYHDYKDSVASIAADLTNTSVADCTGKEGVWSMDCKASIAPAVLDFYKCSGFHLDTNKPAVVVPVVPTPAPGTTTPNPTTITAATVSKSSTTTTIVSSMTLALIIVAIVGL